jgi:hypothetical protein
LHTNLYDLCFNYTHHCVFYPLYRVPLTESWSLFNLACSFHVYTGSVLGQISPKNMLCPKFWSKKQHFFGMRNEQRKVQTTIQSPMRPTGARERPSGRTWTSVFDEGNAQPKGRTSRVGVSKCTLQPPTFWLRPAPIRLGLSLHSP